MMTDERLAEIENVLAHPGYECDTIAEAGTDLIAEVRRLRRENLLLNLSRGTPIVMGQD